MDIKLYVDITAEMHTCDVERSGCGCFCGQVIDAHTNGEENHVNVKTDGS